MKIAGFIEKLTHDLSKDVWLALIDEMPQLEHSSKVPMASGEGFEDPFADPLLAYLMDKDEKTGEFHWTEDDEISVRGDLENVQGVAEQAATRLGGRFMPTL